MTPQEPAPAALLREPVSPTPLHKVWISALVLFLLVFPKGGIKVGGVPMTWGYAALAAASLVPLLALLGGRSQALARVRLVVLAGLVPFQLIGWGAFLAHGTESIGFAASFFVAFFFLPVVFLLLLGSFIDRIDPAFLLRWLRRGVLAVAVYGIFLFAYKIATGSFVEVPYLTVNAGDVGTLEDKYIDRGGVFKLISTYNNGNLYGISILMLLPLYAALEPSFLRNGVVKASLVLTLSRTVWAGLIFYELVSRVYVRRISLRNLAVLLLSLLLVAVGVWYALDLLGVGTAFLLDRTLGGRHGQWRELEGMTLLPAVRFESILEIVYLSILQNFGVVGLASFLCAMSLPLLLYASRALPLPHTLRMRSIACGLVIYLFVSLSDGAILYIPVMAFYWFLVSLLISCNPLLADADASPRSAPPYGSSQLPASRELQSA